MMLQTPTPPPLNDNAATAVTAAITAAAMTTPGGTPIAATTPVVFSMLPSSRTTGKTMTSTIGAGASGSGVPNHTTGGNIGGTNTNLAFASLGGFFLDTHLFYVGVLVFVPPK
jgi:hypothetical protein